MPSIVVDTGPLIALMYKRDRQHEAAKAFFQRTSSADLIVNAAVLTEAALSLQPAVDVLARLLRHAQAALHIDAELDGDLPRIADLLEKYADLPADFADASLIALCERRGLDTIATLDRDFEIYRLPRGKKFRNVFFDAAG